METDASYWTLHEWVFKAYELGLGNEHGCIPLDICGCWFLGPNWKEEAGRWADELKEVPSRVFPRTGRELGVKYFGD